MKLAPYIIFLNGTSSAGKTSISKKIQELSSIPFIHLEIDVFLNMIRFEHIDCEAVDGVNDVCQKLISGFHQCFGAVVKAGNSVIIDHVLQESNWLLECLKILKDQRVYFVGVHCDLDNLNEREILRGDRPLGLASLQFDKVHFRCIYDVEVNSSKQSVKECTEIIMEFVRNQENPKAWSQLLALYNKS